MKVAIIGRSEWMYDTMIQCYQKGIEIPLIITSKEAPEYKYSANDFKNFAEKIGAHYIYTPKIEAQVLTKIPEIMQSIDIGLSVNYSGVISQEIIDLFPMGILNAHGGDLPRYRGNACQAWALLNKEEKIGLCIHKMIGGELDSGDIIAREYLPVNINTRIGEINQWMTSAIPKLMLSAMHELNTNSSFFLEKQSKDAKDALRCYPRNPTDGKINWNLSNEEILRLINASSEPYSGAYCEYEDEKLIIWRAQILDDDENYLAIPGQVAQIFESGEVVVITGKGKLALKVVEKEGKKGPPSNWIKSIRRRMK